MKSSMILDVLKVWIKNYGGSYKTIQGRKGDRLDEYLIGNNELKNTYIVKDKKKIYYIVDYNKNASKPLKNIISSQNSKKLNEKDLLNLLKIGMN